MLATILKAIVLGICLYVVYFLVGLLVVAFGLPVIVSLIIGVLLAIGFIIWVLRAFDIKF